MRLGRSKLRSRHRQCASDRLIASTDRAGWPVRPPLSEHRIGHVAPKDALWHFRAMARFHFLVVLGLVACARPRVRDALELGALDPALVRRLDATDAGTRRRAAFELGELGIAWRPVVLTQQVEAEAHLVQRLEREEDDTVREELVAALGRVGRSRGRKALIAELSTTHTSAARAGFALSHLYRRLRDHDLDPSFDAQALAHALSRVSVTVRRGIVAALADADRPTTRALLRRALRDEDATCRAFAARGLSLQAQPDDAPLFYEALHDSDERVAAFAALATTRLVEKGLAPTIALDVLERALDVLRRPSTTLALADAGLLSRELAPLFAQLAVPGSLGCRAALAHDRILGHPELIDTLECEDRDRLVARLYADTVPARVTDLGPLLALSSGSDVARAGAAEALGRYMDDPRARARLLALCADPVPAVWGAAAESASTALLREAGPMLLLHVPAMFSAEELEPTLSLIAALGLLAPAHAAEALRPLLGSAPPIARAAEDALEKLGARPRNAPALRVAAMHAPYDELALPPLLVVRLETARGVVRIRLDVGAAPRTVRNFVGLVQHHFYDGLGFHRVVPGFVAQGGDPRGDGSGSAGWLVPCEPNALPYVEGTVGMALSGQDTGGSQFFVTLLPEPHLEGRYTAFGRVEEGMDVVRSLQPGDLIDHATMEPATSR